MGLRLQDAAAMGAVLALAATSVAVAQGSGGRMGAVRQACAADVASLCPGVQPGGGRIRECLRQKAEKLSDGCRQAVKAARAAHGRPPAS